MRAPSQRKVQQKADTRQRILEAAGALFREHGIDGVGVDAVMHAAGLTHGGFYLHFASKDALVAEVAEASLARAAARWDRISREPDREAALARIVGSVPRSGTRRGGGARLHADDAGAGGRAARRVARGDHRGDADDAGCAGQVFAGPAAARHDGAIDDGGRGGAGADRRRSRAGERIPGVRRGGGCLVLAACSRAGYALIATNRTALTTGTAKRGVVLPWRPLRMPTEKRIHDGQAWGGRRSSGFTADALGEPRCITRF